ALSPARAHGQLPHHGRGRAGADPRRRVPRPDDAGRAREGRTMSGAAVRLENVAFSYGETAMSFDLDVEASEIVAIMGPSGSGKSTLLNLVAGFEAPSSGRILIGGEDAAGLPPAQRPVSMVFQE